MKHSQPLRPETNGDSLRCCKADRFWLQENYPWIIVRLLPNAQCYVVARFYTRSQADEHKRCLNRFMPAAEFEVVFDVPLEVIDWPVGARVLSIGVNLRSSPQYGKGLNPCLIEKVL